jgi:small subunit ribosomal protein S17
MGKRKEFIGTVIGDKMSKTRIVRVMRMSKHPKYSRIVRKYSKYKVHDEKSMTKAGDLVQIEETRPLSKDKRFIIKGVLKQAELAHVELKEQTL